MLTDSNIIEIRVLNTELSTHYYLHVREDRIRAFYDFMAQDRRAVPAPAMPGLSGRAIAGLDAIFHRRPSKFPAHDLLAWFRDNQAAYLGTQPEPAIDAPEIEDALERFSALYPPDT